MEALLGQERGEDLCATMLVMLHENLRGLVEGLNREWEDEHSSARLQQHRFLKVLLRAPFCSKCTRALTCENSRHSNARLAVLFKLLHQLVRLLKKSGQTLPLVGAAPGAAL